MITLNVGSVYAFMLRDGQEVFGEVIGQHEDGFIRLKHPAFVFESQPDVPGNPPKKTLIGGSESGNFLDEVFISEDKIIYVKTVVKDSELWSLYIQSATDDEIFKHQHKEYKS